MTAIVYLVTNQANGKRYVGVTSKLLCQRRAHHYCVARAGKMSATRKGRKRPAWVTDKIVSARYANAGTPQYWGA